MSTSGAPLSRLSAATSKLARRFRSDERGSISILGATFLAVLLGVGTAALKAGDSYAARLRDVRAADIAVRTIAKMPGGATGKQDVAEKIGSMNGSTLGSFKTIISRGRIIIRFPCGVEVVI